MSKNSEVSVYLESRIMEVRLILGKNSEGSVNFGSRIQVVRLILGKNSGSVNFG